MWKELLASPDRVAIFVAEHEDQLIGFSCGGVSNDEGAGSTTGEMWSLYVLRPFWNQGIGKKLHDVLLEELVIRGFEDATLWVMESNERTRRWYERQGWTLDGSQKTVELWGAAIPEVRYRRHIGPVMSMGRAGSGSIAGASTVDARSFPVPSTRQELEEHPEVLEAIERVRRDIENTTPLRPRLEATRSPDRPDEWFLGFDGGMSTGGRPDTEQMAVSLAGNIQDVLVLEGLGRAWPRCPGHGRHPLIATIHGDQAWWLCPHDRHPHYRIGWLEEDDAPEPPVEDGTIRWVLGIHGVIAHSEGDVWFPTTMLRRQGLVPGEGDRVEFEVEGGARQGAFRRATRIGDVDMR
jgi:hypothetical protein